MPVRRTPVALAAAVMVVAGTAPAVAKPVTDQEMPFPCRQEWYGSSRSSHSPSHWSVDWNRTDDLGAVTVASGAGTVSRVEDLGGRSYGRYVVVDHDAGESTLYAHLQAVYVAVGQRVDQGQLLGRVGESGGVTGPHLHYEQRAEGRVQEPWFHDAAFEMNTTGTSRNCVDVPVAGDWDRDGSADVGVFGRGKRGVFRLPVGAEVRRTRLGGGIDDPLVGDWDGDGTTDVAVRRPTAGTFLLREADGDRRTIEFGLASDRGVAGDWDGNGTTEVGVWRPSRSAFRLRQGDGSVQTVPLGTPGSLPVTGDWNGDGRSDVGVYAAGGWSLQATRRDGSTWSRTVTLGGPADLPVTGDWDGNGICDVGVWTPSTATFSLGIGLTQPRRSDKVVTRRFGRPR